MATRIAQHRGYRVIGVDLVPSGSSVCGTEVLDLEDHDDLPGTIREMTGGRGPDFVIGAVGMERTAHPSPGSPI